MGRTLRSRPLHRPGWVGFSLIGLLIVMAIILYMTAGGGYLQQVGKTRQSGQQLVVKINTRDLLTSIAAHELNTGELPADMAALEVPPMAFADQWGTQLRFEYEDERARPVMVIITSAGPDIEFDTEDDVVTRERLPF